MASAVALIRDGWAPVFDERGTIAALTVDSFSLDPPLVGMPTALGFDETGPLSHAGPLGFWLLAAPTKLLGAPGEGLILGALAVTLLSIAAIAVSIRQRGDERLEIITLGLVAAVVAGIGGSILTDPFNPYLGVMPFLLCLVSAWGVLAGLHRQLWMFVVAGSFAAQTHLGYVPLVVSLVVLVAAVAAVDAVRTSGWRRRRLTTRIIPVGVVIGLVAWIGPIADQLFGNQNLVRLWRSQLSGGDAQVAGMGHGLALAVEMTSIPPLWLLGRARDQPITDPSFVRILLSTVTIGLVVACGIWAVRRKDRELTALSLVSVVSLVIATLSSARVNRPYAGYFDPETLLSYRMFWWPVGMMFMLTLLWGTFRFGSEMSTGGQTNAAFRAAAPVASAVAVVVVVLLVPLGYRSPPDGWDNVFRQDVKHARAVAELPDSPDTVVVRFRPTGVANPEGDLPEHSLSMGLVAQLRLQGIAVRFPSDGDEVGNAAFAYRDEHRSTGNESHVLLYRVGPDAYADPPPGYRRLSAPTVDAGEPANPFAVPSAVFISS